MFDSIVNLRPHFFSIREIDKNVSLDIKLPVTWKYEQIVKPYSTVRIKVQDKNDKHTLISIVSDATADGYDVVFNCASEVINVNREMEEKQRLFQQKVKELEKLFHEQSLDKLKELTFEDDVKEELTERIELVREGEGEGPDGDRESQEESD